MLAAVLIAIVVVRSSGEKVLNENGDTLVLVGKDAGPSDGVGLQGTLVDVGGCLGVDGSDGQGTSVVVVWPHGTTIKTPDPLRVTVDDSTYARNASARSGSGASARRAARYDVVGVEASPTAMPSTESPAAATSVS